MPATMCVQYNNIKNLTTQKQQTKPEGKESRVWVELSWVELSWVQAKQNKQDHKSSKLEQLTN